MTSMANRPPGPRTPAASLPVTQGEMVTLRFETAVPVVGLRVGVWTGGPPNPPIDAPVANPSTSQSTWVPVGT